MIELIQDNTFEDGAEYALERRLPRNARAIEMQVEFCGVLNVQVQARTSKGPVPVASFRVDRPGLFRRFADLTACDRRGERIDARVLVFASGADARLRLGVV